MVRLLLSIVFVCGVFANSIQAQNIEEQAERNVELDEKFYRLQTDGIVGPHENVGVGWDLTRLYFFYQKLDRLVPTCFAELRGNAERLSRRVSSIGYPDLFRGSRLEEIEHFVEYPIDFPRHCDSITESYMINLIVDLRRWEQSLLTDLERSGNIQ